MLTSPLCDDRKIRLKSEPEKAEDIIRGYMVGSVVRDENQVKNRAMGVLYASGRRQQRKNSHSTPNLRGKSMKELAALSYPRSLSYVSKLAECRTSARKEPK